MTAPHCIKPASITITASIAASIACWCVATVPTERLCDSDSEGSANLRSIRRPERSRPEGGEAEGPPLYDKRLAVERRSLHTAPSGHWSGRRRDSAKTHFALV